MRKSAFRVLPALVLCAGLHQAFAQGTAFTYQGRLNDGGSAANGSYDLTFTLYAASSGGSAVAGPLTNSVVGVSNGLFIATLDFGDSVFNGNPYWLGIGVRTNGGGVFTTLSPRQQLTPTPYAIFASTAGQLTGNALQQVDNQALIVVNSTVNTATNNLLLTANAGILSATNNFMATATNIASALTNGLASTNFVNSAVQTATNNALTLASNSFYGVGNVSGFQTAAQVQTATNNLLTTANSGILLATNNVLETATNSFDASGAALTATNAFASGELVSATNNVLIVATNAANLIGVLPQYPTVQIATNAPFTNAILISPDGTNRAWSAGTNLFDVAGAGTAAVNSLGNTVAVSMTNANNQFVGSLSGNAASATTATYAQYAAPGTSNIVTYQYVTNYPWVTNLIGTNPWLTNEPAGQTANNGLWILAGTNATYGSWYTNVNGISTNYLCRSLVFNNWILDSTNNDTTGATIVNLYGGANALTTNFLMLWYHMPSYQGTTLIGYLGIPSPGTATNIIQVGISSANYFGQASGLTNFGANTLDQTNLDNTAWMYAQAQTLSDNPYNIGRFSWTGLLNKLRLGQTVRLEFDAIGQPPELNVGLVLYSPLTNIIPYGGWYGGSPALDGFAGFAYTGPVLQPMDLYHSGYLMTTNTGGIIPARALSKAWNVIEIDYLVWPQGSTFTVNTNVNGGGAYSPISGTISTVGAGTNVASFFWTNSAGPQLIGFTLVSTSPGTNAFMSEALLDNTITNGFVTGLISGNGGDSLADMVSGPGSNIVAQLYSIWKPDIIFLQDLDYATNMATNLPLFCQMVSNASPNTKIVFCATYPDGTGPIEGMAEARMMATVAAQYGQACFDGYSPFVSTNAMAARGLDAGGDWTHMPAAYPFYGYWLWLWMDFQDFYYQGVTPAPTSFSGTFTNGIYYGNGVGLTNVSASGITGLGSAAVQNTNFFDLAGVGAAAASAATNAGNIVFTNTTLFDTNGAASSVLTVATNAANLIGILPQYPRVQVATNAPFTNAIMISPDGTNRQWAALTNVLPTSTNNNEALVINTNATSGFSYAHALPILIAPIFVTGYSRPQIMSTNLQASGNWDAYTVPAGKKFFPQYAFLSAYGVNTITYYFERKDTNGTYWPLNVANTDSAGSGVSAAPPMCVFNAGETVAMNIAETGGGGHVYMMGFQFDATAPIRTIFATVNNTSNTLYTCPAGTFTKILSTTVAASPPTIYYYNGSASTGLQPTNFFVPNGGYSMAIGYQTGIGASGFTTVGGPTTTLYPGDVLWVGSNSGAVGQYAWTTIVEESQ